MKKILIWSVHPGSQTGFGKVCKNLALGLKDNFEVFIYPFQGNRLQENIDGVTVLLNPLEGFHGLLKHYIDEIIPDAVIQISDIWTLTDFLGEVHVPNLISYTPLHGVPVPPLFKKGFQYCKTIVPMCQWAEKEYRKAGIDCTHYIYHGLNSEFFKPRDKTEARDMFSLPQGKFTVLIVAANGSVRKNLFGQMRAFREFQKRVCPDAILFMWTYPFRDSIMRGGWDMKEVWDSLNGDPNKLILVEKDQFLVGVDEETQSYMYSAADVLMECTMSEGFGLPVIESMACGTPVIATDFSSMPELVLNSGYMVKPAVWFCENLLSDWTVFPSENDMVEALEHAYRYPQMHQAFATRAIEIASHLDWKKDIIPQWVSLLNSKI